MTPVLLLAISVGGGLGAVCRYIVTEWIAPNRQPWSVAAVNIAGSLIAGLAVGALQAHVPEGALIVATGFCGGLTTFSAFAVDAVQLATRGRHAKAALGVLIQVVIGVSAAAVGLACGALVSL